jgi:hypothetical protein
MSDPRNDIAYRITIHCEVISDSTDLKASRPLVGFSD